MSVFGNYRSYTKVRGHANFKNVDRKIWMSSFILMHYSPDISPLGADVQIFPTLYIYDNNFLRILIYSFHNKFKVMTFKTPQNLFGLSKLFFLYSFLHHLFNLTIGNSLLITSICTKLHLNRTVCSFLKFAYLIVW